MFKALLLVFCVSAGNARLIAAVLLKNDTQQIHTIPLKTDNILGNTLYSIPVLENQVGKSHILKNVLKSMDGRKTKFSANETRLSTTTYTVSINETKRTHILFKIQATITRSKDAVWATITLTFMCVILVLAVAQSRMWKNHKGSESQGVPMPNFNERVLFKDVMERRMNSLKQIFKKKKAVSELELLLPTSEWE